jgi:hypothetical protein
MTPAITNHIWVAIAALLVYAVLRQYLRWLLYIGIGFAVVTSLPYVMRGQAPPWAVSAVPWLTQLAQQAWGTLQPALHL